MSMGATRCPTGSELERAYWTRDVGARAHADACARCRAEWTEIEELVELGRAIAPPPAAPARQEELRTALLSRQMSAAPAPASTRARRARRAALAGAVLAAAAAAAVVWWRLPARGADEAPVASEPPPAPAPAAVYRGRVLDHDGARYLHTSFQPDEVVRLVDGALTVEVEPLASGERFRVVTGDAEVEVIGTAFDVAAEDDALRRVRVLHGRVAVRAAGAPEVLLTAGQSWAAPPPPTHRDAPPTAPGPRPARIESRPDAGAPRAATRSSAQQAYDDGWQAIRAGEFDRAAAAFERAAAADAARTRMAEDAGYWRAVALARAGRAERAAAAFDSFLTAHPSSRRAGEVSAMLGWMLYERGEHSAAARRFRAAVGDPSERVRQSATQGLEALRKAGH